MIRSSGKSGATQVSSVAALESLRFLGRAGLLPAATPDAAATPDYRERLRFIERAHALGFDLNEIRALLRTSDGLSDETIPFRTSLLKQIESVERRITTLMRLREALLQTREGFERRRPCSPCPIIAALQD